MANEKFKVKFGLAVGDTAATIDATTGEGIFAEGDNGQITVGKGVGDNGRIEIGKTGRTVAGTPYIDFHSSASSVDYDVRMLASGPTTPTGSGEGTLTITAASLVHSGNLTVNGNLQVDGNTILGNGSGDTVTITGNTIKSSTTNTALQLDDVNVKVGGELTITGNRIRSSGGSAFPLGDIAVQLNGNNVEVVGILQVTGNTIRASDGNTAQTYNVLTGQYPNITTTGNIVKGAIRNTFAEAAGNIYSFSTTSAGGPTRGISIDNSATGATAQRPGIILRSYGGGLPSGNPVITFLTETARGSAAVPTGLAIGNGLGGHIVGGYADTSVSGTGAGWATETTGNVVGSTAFQTTEAWTGGSGAGSPLGTRYRISTNPTLSANALQTSLEINPQSTLARSDSFSWSKGKTNSTIMASLKDDGTGKTTFSVSKPDATTGGEFALINFDTLRSSGGTYTPTQNGDYLGQFKFNGNALSGGSPGGTTGPGVSIDAQATETWTTLAQGTSVIFTAIKTGATTATQVINASPNALTFKSDLVTLQDSAAVNLVGGKIVYGRQYIEAYSTQNQTNPVASAENLMSFNNTGISNGISIVTNGTTLTRITMSTAGVYNIQFSAQLNQTTGGAHNAFIWLKKNGANVANTAGDTRVAGNGDRIMAAWNYIVSAAAGDYYELAWAANDTNVLLEYVAASAPVPAVPSVILTVVPVGA